MFPPTVLARTLLRLSGADARKFLDSLITQDVGLLDAQPVLYAGLLTPQGKVLADFFLWKDADALILDADPARGPDLARRLAMYRLRAQVEIADISDQLSVHALPAVEPGAVPDPRLTALGWRKLGPPTAPTDAAAYAAHRIDEGAPDLAADASPEEVFALEALFEELHGVAFDKGCFVGQENVSRMKRRATTRRKFCRLAFFGPAQTGPVLANGVEIGRVRATAGEKALAFIRLDRAMDARDALVVGATSVRLDPPDWLILPRAENA